MGYRPLNPGYMGKGSAALPLLGLGESDGAASASTKRRRRLRSQKPKVRGVRKQVYAEPVACGGRGRPRSTEDQRRVLELRELGFSYRSIQDVLRIPHTTARDIVQRGHVMSEAEMFENQARKGPQRVLTWAQETITCGFVHFETANKRLVTVASLRFFILEAFGVDVGESYIPRLMMRNSFTSKVPKARDTAHWRKNVEAEIAQFLFDLWPRVDKTEDLVAIDEKSFWTGGPPRRGYSAAGR